MAQISIIKLSNIENRNLGAEFYHPAKLSFLNKLSKFNDNISDYFTSNKKTIKSANKETTVINLENVNNGFVNSYSNERLSSSKKIIKENDVIISRLRPYLREIALINKKEKTYGSTELIVLREKEPNEELRYILLPFLFTKEVQTILYWSQQGTNHPRFNEKILLNLNFPDIPKKLLEEIKQFVSDAYIKNDEAVELYNEAKETIIKELGFSDLSKIKRYGTFEVNFSDIVLEKRMDPDYFHPDYKKIEEKLIDKSKAKRIRQLDFIKVTTGQYCDEYVKNSEGKPYIRGIDINNGNISSQRLYYIPIKKQIVSKKAKDGDVVVIRVGTIGLSAVLPKEVDGGTISDNLIRLRFDKNELDPHYVGLFLNTVGSQLMVRASRGSVQPRLNQETLKEIYLPILPYTSQEKIGDSVRKSIGLFNESMDMLSKAIEKVEMFINK